MKIRKGFISNSSSTSFVIGDYFEDDKWKKQSIKEVREIVYRIIRAYNIIEKKREQKKKMLTVGRVTDAIIQERIDFEREYGCNKKGKWVKKPLPVHRRKEIEAKKGSIIINSVDDNTIPFVIQEIIQLVLNAEKWHWG